jgi:hypothetical protein
MNSLTRQTKLKLGAALALGLVAWLWWHDAQPSHKDIQTMQTYTEHMQTHCVGRFLIDAPKGVDTGEGSYETQIASVKVDKKSSQPISDLLHLLERDLKDRAAILQSQQTDYGKPRYYGTFTPAPNIRTMRYIPVDGVNDGEKMDGYVVKSGGIFLFKGSAYDDSDIKEIHDFLIDIEPKLSIRDDAVIPTTPGFCINGGLIAYNPKRGENAGFIWTLPGHPDVDFGIGTRTNGDTVDPGLVDREASTLREAGAAVMKHVHTLRKGRFELAGRPAQEWSVEITGDQPELNFKLEIPGAPNDNANPSIALSMHVGGYGEGGYQLPSLTKGEALALWDAVIQSLRQRPGAF